EVPLNEVVRDRQERLSAGRRDLDAGHRVARDDIAIGRARPADLVAVRSLRQADAGPAIVADDVADDGDRFGHRAADEDAVALAILDAVAADGDVVNQPAVVGFRYAIN